ncbi:MAG: hypothetical protein RSD80_01310, partial [Raoultibacter sp.]
LALKRAFFFFCKGPQGLSLGGWQWWQEFPMNAPIHQKACFNPVFYTPKGSFIVELCNLFGSWEGKPAKQPSSM